MYITPDQLADRPGATEIAQVATPERDAIVAADLMDATLRGTDRSAWQPADTAIADLALANVQAAIDDADAVIEGYLARRYTLPLSGDFPILTVQARGIVRYNLHKNRLSLDQNDPIVRDYNNAIKFLTSVASGVLSLGANDPAVLDSTADGEVQMQSSPTVFGRGDRGCW